MSTFKHNCAHNADLQGSSSASFSPHGFNFERWKDDKFDAALAVLANATDAGTLDASYRTAHGRLADNPPWLYIVHDLNPRAISKWHRLRAIVVPGPHPRQHALTGIVAALAAADRQALPAQEEGGAAVLAACGNLWKGVESTKADTCAARVDNVLIFRVKFLGCMIRPGSSLLLRPRKWDGS